MSRGSHYDSLSDYTADVKAARNAHAADMAVQNGMCAVCKINRRDVPSGHRRCLTCRRSKRREVRP